MTHLLRNTSRNRRTSSGIVAEERVAASEAVPARSLLFISSNSRATEERRGKTHLPLPQNPFSEQHGVSFGHKMSASQAGPSWKPVMPFEGVEVVAGEVVCAGSTGEGEVDVVGVHHTVVDVVSEESEEEEDRSRIGTSRGLSLEFVA
jgi:hypothetical protein